MHFVNAKSLLSQSNSMNIYRGCTHGCIYCDSRSLCYGMKHEFTDIEVKINAPQLLESALNKKRSKCMIGTGSMSDPYNHVEEKLHLTRQCASISDSYGFGFTFITKSTRFLNDLDIYKSISQKSKCVVQMTMTTFDENICSVIEPNVDTTNKRYCALKQLRDESIPSVVWISPILPFINDTKENMRGILDYCFDAGVKGIVYFGSGVTLREGDREYFYKKLDESFPGLKHEYMKKYAYSYECISPLARKLDEMVHNECDKYKIKYRPDEVFSYIKEYESKYSGSQLSLL